MGVKTEKSYSQFLFSVRKLKMPIFPAVISGGALWIGPTAEGDANDVFATDGAGNVVLNDPASGTTINNNADNRIITGSGTANTLEAEATLTYEPSTFTLNCTDTLVFSRAGTDMLEITAAATQCPTDNFKTLGGVSKRWKDFYSVAGRFGLGSNPAATLESYPPATTTQGLIVNNPNLTTANVADFQIAGVSKVKIDSSGALTIATATTPGNFFTFPQVDGTSGQVLQTDGAGTVTWETVASGDVSKVGTPVDNQVAVWTGDGTIEGDANLTWDGSTLLTKQKIIVQATGTEAASFVQRTGGAWGGLLAGTSRVNFLVKDGEIFGIRGAEVADSPTDASFTNLSKLFLVYTTGEVYMGSTDAETGPVLTVLSTEKVGINNKTPGAALDITAPDTTTPGLIVNNPTSTTANIVDFQINGTSEFVVNSSGYVGINEATPSHLLHIYVPTTASTEAFRIETSHGSTAGLTITTSTYDTTFKGSRLHFQSVSGDDCYIDMNGGVIDLRTQSSGGFVRTTNASLFVGEDIGFRYNDPNSNGHDFPFAVNEPYFLGGFNRGIDFQVWDNRAGSTDADRTRVLLRLSPSNEVWVGDAVLDENYVFSVNQHSNGPAWLSTTLGDATVTGANTYFTNDLNPGSQITINGNSYTVDSITSNTELELTTTAVATESNEQYTIDSNPFRFGIYKNGGVVVQGAVGQPRAILDVKNSGGTTLFNVGSTGAVTIAPSSTSAVGLTVNNPTSTTANIADFQINGSTQWRFDNGGDLVAADSSQQIIQHTAGAGGITFSVDAANSGMTGGFGQGFLFSAWHTMHFRGRKGSSMGSAPSAGDPHAFRFESQDDDPIMEILAHSTQTANFLNLTTSSGSDGDVLYIDVSGNVVFGVASGTPTARSIQGQSGTGTDISGANVSVIGGDGSATNSNGGDVLIYGGALAGSGTNGNVILAHTGSAVRGLVGVGMNAPTAQLQVLARNTTTPGLIVNNPTSTTANIANFQINSVSQFKVTSAGYCIIPSRIGLGADGGTPVAHLEIHQGGADSAIYGIWVEHTKNETAVRIEKDGGTNPALVITHDSGQSGSTMTLDRSPSSTLTANSAQRVLSFTASFAHERADATAIDDAGIYVNFASTGAPAANSVVYGVYSTTTGNNANITAHGVYAKATSSAGSSIAAKFEGGSASTIGLIVNNLTATTADVARFQINGTSQWSINSSGNLVAADAKNIVLNATTGTKIGTATTQKLGFWNATPIVQPAGSAQAALTNSTGGSADATLSAVSGSGDDATINDNFTELFTLQNAIRTALVNSGIMKGAA